MTKDWDGHEIVKVFLSIVYWLFLPRNLYLWPPPLPPVHCTSATWTFVLIPQRHLAHSHLTTLVLALPSAQKALPLDLCMTCFLGLFRYELKWDLLGVLFPDYQLQLAILSTMAPAQREPIPSITLPMLLSSWNSLLLEIVLLTYILLVCSLSPPVKHKLCESRNHLCFVHCHILSS